MDSARTPPTTPLPCFFSSASPARRLSSHHRRLLYPLCLHSLSSSGEDQIFFLKDLETKSRHILISREQLHGAPQAHQEYMMDGLGSSYSSTGMVTRKDVLHMQVVSVGVAGSIALSSFAPANVQCFASSCRTASTCWVVRNSLLNTRSKFSYDELKTTNLYKNQYKLIIVWNCNSFK